MMRPWRLRQMPGSRHLCCGLTACLSALIVAIELCAAAQSEPNPYDNVKFGPTAEQRLERIRHYEEILKSKSLSDYRRESAQFGLYMNRAVAHATIGYYGEIIIVSQFPDLGDIHLLVLPDANGGFEIAFKNGIGRDKCVYAHVSRDGKIRYQKQSKMQDARKEGRPRRWPFRDGSGGLAIPEPDTAVADANSKAARALIPPDKCVGWCYRLRNGWLLSPGKDAQPTEDIIWAVRRDDGGLGLLHAGPLTKGLYLSVRPDCIVETSGDAAIKMDASEPIYWGLKTRNGLPAVAACMLDTLQSTTPPISYVDESGLIGWPGDTEIE